MPSLARTQALPGGVSGSHATGSQPANRQSRANGEGSKMAGGTTGKTMSMKKRPSIVVPPKDLQLYPTRMMTPTVVISGKMDEHATKKMRQSAASQPRLEDSMSSAATPVRRIGGDSDSIKQGVDQPKSRSINGFQEKLTKALSSSLNWETDKPSSESCDELRWTASAETFRLAPGLEIPKLDNRTVLPVLEDRLYFQATDVEPRARKGVYYFTVDDDIVYQPFCADFGPFNLGMTHQFMEQLRSLLSDDALKSQKIVMLADPGEDELTNAIYLIGAFLCVHLGATPDQAWQPFSRIEYFPCIPYRDATWAQSSYDLHVTDCWAGLRRGISADLYDPETFREREYFYYDDPKNGDMHEVVKGKFIAFKGPTAKRYQVGHSLLPTDYVDVFRVKGVRTVIRLNENTYERMKFVQEGFHHFDLPFTDCSTPPDEVADKFLRICENSEGLLAVHCLAGLGRTGTLIGMYMIKHMGFTANEAMAWLRIVRPGSVIGPQQEYLAEVEGKLCMLGAKNVAGFGVGEKGGKFEVPHWIAAGVDRRRDSVEVQNSKAAALAKMITDGMEKRDNMRQSTSHGFPANDAKRDINTPVTPLPKEASFGSRRESRIGTSSTHRSVRMPPTLKEDDATGGTKSDKTLNGAREKLVEEMLRLGQGEEAPKPTAGKASSVRRSSSAARKSSEGLPAGRGKSRKKSAQHFLDEL